MAEGIPRQTYRYLPPRQRECCTALLERCENMVRSGRLQEAFRLFAEAFDQGRVEKSQLKTLATALVKFQKNKMEKELIEKKSTKEGSALKTYDYLTCTMCNSLFTDPITLPCGHTFCKLCLQDEFTSEVCTICGSSDTEETKAPTFLLCGIIVKWFPKRHELGLKKTEGRKLLTRGMYDQAIDVFSLVLREEPTDVNCLSWRGECYSCLGMLDLALKDIEVACKIVPNSFRLLYRKTRVLSKIGDQAKLVSNLLQCSALEPNNSELRSELEAALYELFSLDFGNIKKSVGQMNFFSGEQRKGLQSLFTNGCDLDQPDGDVIMSDYTGDDSKGNALKITSASNKDKELFAGRKREPGSSSCEEEYNCTRESVSEHSSKRTVTGSYDKEVKISQDLSSSLNRDNLFDDFECKLCCSLLYKPVTSPCGHSFCSECLRRSLDYRVDCPCCRNPLNKYLSERRNNVTVVLERIIKGCFAKEYETRDINYQQEMLALKRSAQEAEFEIPIFICTLAFPSVPCPLHIFEPKYKLMIRRCIESGLKQFGMCVASEDMEEPFPTVGTILKIKEVAYLPDGRSLVNTTGCRRFQVISHSMKDGYNVAKVKWLLDEVDDEEEAKEIRKLDLNGFKMLKFWFGHLSSEQQECIVNAIGDMPKQEQLDCSKNDQPTWLWWALAALPLQNKPKLIILAMTSVVERLRSIMRFLMLMIKMQQRSTEKQ